MVFIDSRVNDLDLLVSQFDAGTEYRVLDATSDGLLQMQESLAGKNDYSSIQIISHGAPGTITIGSTMLDAGTLTAYTETLSQIGSSLSSTGDILLYGCNVGAVDEERAFIESLARLTQADVAASDDVTGATALGGDWVLEVENGNVESAVGTIDNAQNYPYTLGSATYSSVRDHLDQFINIDFSKIPADDLVAITPLQAILLKKNNIVDSDINVYNFLYAIERMAQIEDELFAATNDIDSLFGYMSAVDNNYYKSMLSSYDSLKASFDSIMVNAKPGLLTYAAINFATVWEGISGVSRALFEAVEAGADGIKTIFSSAKTSYSILSAESFKVLTENIELLNIVQKGELSQFIFTALNSLIAINENTALLITVSDTTKEMEILTDSILKINEILDAYSQVQESLKGLPELEIVVTVGKIVSAIMDTKSLFEDYSAITSAFEASSLSGLSKEFLDSATTIKLTEAFDVAKSIIDLFLPLLKAPQFAALTTYFSEAIVTISDIIAIGMSEKWHLLVSEFDTYKNLVSVVDSYQSNLSSWLRHADTVSGGAWGTNLSSNIPTEAFPLTTIFSDKYDGWLENEPKASGRTLEAGETYTGTISAIDDPGDWFILNLVTGEDYHFQVTEGTLSYFSITLYNSKGQLYAYSNGALNTSTTQVIEGTALESGTYYIGVKSYSSSYGTYTVTYNTVDLEATITEFKDAPDTIETPYSISTGETFSGNLNYTDSDKQDWIAINLVAGQDYRLQVTEGSASFVSMRLYNSEGVIYAYSNGALNTSTTQVIEGTALESGTYYIAVKYDSSYGSYTVTYNTVTLDPTLTELRDAPGTIATPYSIAAGETFSGNMNSSDNDSSTGDWIAINLVAGRDYRIQLTEGSASSVSMRLYDSTGTLYAYSNGSLNTSTTQVIQGTALESGSYYIAVKYDSSYGSYTVTYDTVSLDTTLTEFLDAPGTIATPYSIAAGETFKGNMNSADGNSSTNDWIAVNLVAGQTYHIQLTEGTISSATVKLYDSQGNLFTNATGSTNSTAFIDTTITNSGIYYIAANSSSSYGSYTISVTNTSSTLIGTNGNDLFLATSVLQKMMGNEGNDTVSFIHSDSRVLINLATNQCSGGYAEGDELSSIENLIGSTYPYNVTYK